MNPYRAGIANLLPSSNPPAAGAPAPPVSIDVDHGLSDQSFSAMATLDYYTRMAKANGGAEQVQNWSRIYLVPACITVAAASSHSTISTC